MSPSKHPSNTLTRICNPLAGIPTDTLLQNVVDFAAEKSITDPATIRLLQKGALVAQDPENAENIEGAHALDAEEVAALKKEEGHKWSHPARLYLTIVVCSIGACVQGWDQTGTNGANLSFPEVFGIGSASVHDEMILGLVNAAPYIASALIGCWIADPVNKYVGRRGAIFISGLLCFFPVLGSAFCQSWEQLLVCRLLLGVGMGLKGATVPIFASENSPASIRGALVMSWQLWTAFGILIGTTANLVVCEWTNAWRWKLGSACLPAVPLVLLIYSCPESPRWYMSKSPIIRY